MTSDFSTFYNTDEFAEDVTYTPSGGDAVGIKIILDETKQSIMKVAPPAESIAFRVQRSEVANPLWGDIYTISGETWYFAENLPGDSTGEWKLLVSRSDKRRIG